MVDLKYYIYSKLSDLNYYCYENFNYYCRRYVKTKIDITAHFASKQAQEKIVKLGGKINIVKK